MPVSAIRPAPASARLESRQPSQVDRQRSRSSFWRGGAAALVALCAVSPAAAQDRDRAVQTDRFTKTVSLGAAGELDVSNISGNITITAGEGTVVKIDALKQARSRTEQEAARQLKLVDIRVIERPGLVEVRTEYPRNERSFNVDVSYSITLPASTRVIVKTISGDVLVSRTRGAVRLETISGRINVDTGSQTVTAKTVSGTIEVSAVGAEADLTLGAISGDLVLRGLKLKALDASTVSGNISVANLTAQRVEAGSVSGNVEYSGPLPKGSRFNLKSHSGNVRVTVTGDSGFEVIARSFSGGVQTDLSLTRQDEGNRRGRDRRDLRGTYGDGSALLHLTTFSGSIQIGKR